jgi:hypothetical protein
MSAAPHTHSRVFAASPCPMHWFSCCCSWCVQGRPESGGEVVAVVIKAELVGGVSSSTCLLASAVAQLNLFACHSLLPAVPQHPDPAPCVVIPPRPVSISLACGGLTPLLSCVHIV